MFSYFKDKLLNIPVFNSMIVSILASLTTALMIILPYLIPGLSWIIWISFVPYILAVQWRKRLQVYTLTFILTLIYFNLIVYLKGMWRIDFIFRVLLSIILAILISEVQILCRRFFSKWGWIPAAVLYTATLFAFHSIIPGIMDALTIIPVSQLISQNIAVTYGGYIIFLVVLLVNGFTSEAMIRFRKKAKYITITVVTIIALVCGLLGGSVSDLSTFTAKQQGLVLQLEDTHFRFFSNE